jgi:hypothetical protein
VYPKHIKLQPHLRDAASSSMGLDHFQSLFGRPIVNHFRLLEELKKLRGRRFAERNAAEEDANQPGSWHTISYAL